MLQNESSEIGLLNEDLKFNSDKSLGLNLNAETNNKNLRSLGNEMSINEESSHSQNLELFERKKKYSTKILEACNNDSPMYF